jgi:Family of unknown function (DUF6328)
VRPAGYRTVVERGEPGETEKERLDRNLIELLNELRVALPGVQVLFAFLLIVPFQQRFGDVTQFQKVVYFVTLLLAALACALLIAPSAQHRVLFHAKEKRTLVATGNTLAIAGMAALAMAMVGVLTLITDFLYGATTTIVVAVAAGAVFAVLWYALPLWRRLR